MSDRDQQIAEACQLAVRALEAVEWTYSPSPWSPVCHWCRGYERHPQMDQDYYGKAGHKPDCVRQAALAALRQVRAEGTGQAQLDALVQAVRDDRANGRQTLEQDIGTGFRLATAAYAYVDAIIEAEMPLPPTPVGAAANKAGDKA